MWCVQVVVERSKVTWPGARVAKKNEGMPNYENNNVRGTLFITFDVNFPKGELTAEDKAGERERERSARNVCGLYPERYCSKTTNSKVIKYIGLHFTVNKNI